MQGCIFVSSKTIARSNLWEQAATPLQMADPHIRWAQSFNRICEVAPMCTPFLDSSYRPVQLFLLPTSHRPTLHFATPFPQIVMGTGEIWPPSKTWFLGPTLPTIPISPIDSAILTQYMLVTKGQTDRQINDATQLLTKGHLRYICDAA